MKAISHIKGDTFSKSPRYVDGKYRQPRDLSTSTFTASIKNTKGDFEEELVCTVLDQSVNPGKCTVSASTDTTAWPVGTLSMKVTRHVAGASSSIIVPVIVKEF